MSRTCGGAFRSRAPSVPRRKFLYVFDCCDRRNPSSSVSRIWPDMQETLRPSFAADDRPPLQAQGRLEAVLLAWPRSPDSEQNF